MYVRTSQTYYFSGVLTIFVIKGIEKLFKIYYGFAKSIQEDNKRSSIN